MLFKKRTHADSISFVLWILKGPMLTYHLYCGFYANTNTVVCVFFFLIKTFGTFSMNPYIVASPICHNYLGQYFWSKFSSILDGGNAAYSVHVLRVLMRHLTNQSPRNQVNVSAHRLPLLSEDGTLASEIVIDGDRVITPLAFTF